MKISIAFKNNQSFLLKRSNPSDLLTNSIEKIKNLIDKAFPHQYLTKVLVYSITPDGNQTLQFSCRTLSKEIEQNGHVEEIGQLLTKSNLRKIFSIDNILDIRQITIFPTKKIEAIKRIDENTLRIDPYFADYCVRNTAYCKDLLKRDVQYINIEYERNEHNIECSTGNFEEKFIKNANARSLNIKNPYHCFIMAILKHENDALKNKLLSSGIRKVLMKNEDQDISLEVVVSNKVKYSYSIKKSHLLLNSYSDSSPLLTTGMYAYKINGKDPDPYEERNHLLSSSNFF